MDITIFNPLFWLTIVLCSYFFLKRPIWKKRLKYFGIFLFLVLTNNWLSTLALHLWEYDTIKAHNIYEPYDIGIVLGPFIDEGDYLPIRSESVRFTQAIQLYKLHKFDKFLLSGNDISELARQHLIDLCVSPEDILTEDKSNNTFENALLTARYLKEKGDTSQRLLLVTSALHMRRAIKCFDKVGLKTTPLSVDYLTSCSEVWGISLSDIIPSRSALWRWGLLLREGGSMAYFKIKNYI